STSDSSTSFPLFSYLCGLCVLPSVISVLPSFFFLFCLVEPLPTRSLKIHATIPTCPCPQHSVSSSSASATPVAAPWPNPSLSAKPPTSSNPLAQAFSPLAISLLPRSKPSKTTATPLKPFPPSPSRATLGITPT